jgi:hypothetical protein
MSKTKSLPRVIRLAITRADARVAGPYFDHERCLVATAFQRQCGLPCDVSAAELSAAGHCYRFADPAGRVIKPYGRLGAALDLRRFTPFTLALTRV